jgi:hypothetical protein
MPTGLALNPVSVQRNKYYQYNGTKSYVYLMEKWGFEPTMVGKYFQGTMMQQQGKFGPPGHQIGGRLHSTRVVKKRTGPNEEDAEKVTADDLQNDSLYNAEVWVGTPPQKFFLDLDTASADTWLWSTKLPEETLRAAGSKHTVFDPEKSSSFEVVEGSSWNIRFGSHTYASGQIVGKDTVTIGQLNLFKQTIQLADFISPEFVRGSGATDGTLGLAWGKLSSIEPQPAEAPVETMMEKEHTQIHETQRLFTMKLGNWNGDHDGPDQGFFTFGFINYDLVKETNMVLHYCDVDNSKGLWQYKSGSYTINGETHTRTGGDNTAIVDTGTPLVLLDDEVCNAIYAAIPGAKYDGEAMGWVFPADIREEQLPSVGLEVDGKIFAISKEDLGFSVCDHSSGYIYGGIQSRGNLPMDIVGDTFLKSVYSIFDLANKRFGVTARPELKSEVELAPGAEVKSKDGFFHRLIHRVNHGKGQAPEQNVADAPMA